MKGPGTNQQQVESLVGKMSQQDVDTARNIANSHCPNVVTLAYKLMRVNASQNKLPKSVARLLANLSDEDAQEVRAKLASAKK